MIVGTCQVESTCAVCNRLVISLVPDGLLEPGAWIDVMCPEPCEPETPIRSLPDWGQEVWPI